MSRGFGRQPVANPADEPSVSDDDIPECCSFQRSKRRQEKSEQHPPGHAPRRCTDVLCLLVFLAALGALGWIWNYSRKHGDLRRLYHGYNFLGELCGVKSDLYDKTSQPVLFWCKDPSQPSPLLDLSKPICRDKCPDSDQTNHPCYTGVTKGPKVPFDNIGSFTMEMTYKYAEVQDYKSYPLMGIYCIPDATVNAQLYAQLTDYFKNNIASEALMWGASLANAWPALLAAAGIAMVFGFVNLCLLGTLARIIVYTSMAVLVIVPTAFGALMVYGGSKDFQLAASLTEQANELSPEAVEYAGHLYEWASPEWRTTIGCCLVGLGLLLGLIFCCCLHAVKVAIAVVRSAAECMIDMPTLIFQPLIALTVQMGAVAVLLLGFIQLMSVGEIKPVSIEEYAAVASLNDVNGVFRTFTYTEDQLQLLAYYLLMIFWLWEVVTATSQFVLAYAVQKWYFTPYGQDGEKDGRVFCPMAKGYSVAFLFHLGSFAFGSFLVAVTRLLRVIMTFIAKQAKDQGNAVGAAAASCCTCCLTCFQKTIVFLNKNAYIDIAVNSNGFCHGARNALWTIAHNLPEIGILNGATWIIQLACIGSITSFSTWMVYLGLTQLDYFNDPTSTNYVQDKIPALIAAGFISFVVAFSFMNVFDMVADTILYCKAVEENRRAKGLLDARCRYAPRSLDRLIEHGPEDSDASDDYYNGGPS